jgi:hypothetical protein
MRLNLLKKIGLLLAVTTSAIALATVPASAHSSSQASTQPFRFGAWGDMPYAKAGDGPKMPTLIASINASDIDFSIYDGDIKDGSSKCTDDVYTDALKMFGAMRKPVHYIVGDNEWTDCHRLNNGGYDNLERLAHLRKVMFVDDQSFGQTRMPVIRQGKPGEKFSENIRFQHKGVMFVGLNVPGSNNNSILDDKDCTHKSARTRAQCDADNAEFLDRDAANIAWMATAFEIARGEKSPGLVLTIQGDPGFDLPETEDIDESKAREVSGYRNFMDKLTAETERYDGQVLLIHGDTHYFKFDKPLYSPTKVLPNFSRLETFGSPLIHWVRVTVDPASPEVFTVRPVMVKAN